MARLSGGPRSGRERPAGGALGAVRRPGVAAAALILLAGCERPYPPPPPLRTYEGLPVSGSLADARRAGFGNCLEANVSLRCRRTGVVLMGQGPYSAAIDLEGDDGRGGFRQLTLWHPEDQSSLVAFDQLLRRRGWRVCFTGDGGRDVEVVYVRAGSPVRIALDLSFYIKRSLRITPVRFAGPLRCWAVLGGEGRAQ
jgi:hypothetical protein